MNIVPTMVISKATLSLHGHKSKNMTTRAVDTVARLAANGDTSTKMGKR